MLTLFENEIKVFALFVLPQNNWSFESGKTNGVMPARVKLKRSCNSKGILRHNSIIGRAVSSRNGNHESDISGEESGDEEIGRTSDHHFGLGRQR
jgi:hypothetical protein